MKLSLLACLMRGCLGGHSTTPLLRRSSFGCVVSQSCVVNQRSPLSHDITHVTAGTMYSFAFCRTPNNTRLVFQLFYLFLVQLLKSNCLLITTKGLISRCYLH